MARYALRGINDTTDKQSPQWTLRKVRSWPKSSYHSTALSINSCHALLTNCSTTELNITANSSNPCTWTRNIIRL